ncbi:hypothetical protein FACS1894211_14060 [Clostridia bacterium]|nr:hypothetical protein FACS1894211_14060 [Clostridia bacterium]
MPALTKPMTMTVVAEEDCIIAVTPAPIPTLAARLLLILLKRERIPPEAFFSKHSLNMTMPTKKMPTPVSKDSTESNSVIRSSKKPYINFTLSIHKSEANVNRTQKMRSGQTIRLMI